YPVGARLAILQDGSALVFYKDTKIVKRRKINAQGKLSGPAAPAFSPPFDKQWLIGPEVAFSTTSNGTMGLLVANDEGFDKNASTSYWGQALDSQGRPVGAAVMLHEIPSTDYTPTPGALAIALPRKPSDTRFQFIFLEPYSGEDTNILKLDLEVQP